MTQTSEPGHDVVDPVCGMHINPDHAAGPHDYRGTTYYFCSAGCRASIDETQLPGWLLTVVRNRARDWWRHQLVEERHAQQAQAEEPVDA